MDGYCVPLYYSGKNGGRVITGYQCICAKCFGEEWREGQFMESGNGMKCNYDDSEK